MDNLDKRSHCPPPPPSLFAKGLPPPSEREIEEVERKGGGGMTTRLCFFFFLSFLATDKHAEMHSSIFLCIAGKGPEQLASQPASQSVTSWPLLLLSDRDSSSSSSSTDRPTSVNSCLLRCKKVGTSSAHVMGLALPSPCTVCYPASTRSHLVHTRFSSRRGDRTTERPIARWDGRSKRGTILLLLFFLPFSLSDCASANQ